MWYRILLAMTVLLAPLAAEDEMTRLRVDVKTLGGRPIERASVVINFVEGRSVAKLGKKIVKHWEIRTNQDGIAKLPAIPQGKIQVQVIAKGYQTFGDTYEIEEEEKTIEIRLNPPQPQYSAH
jgi:hypothetical protein